MALYPSYATILYKEPVITPRFKTLKNSFDDQGTERRKRKWLFPKYNVELPYGLISKTDADILLNFFKNRNGTYETFNFINIKIRNYENEYICTGDGSTVSFNLPGKTVSAYTVYEDGVEQTETTDYTITQDVGTDGAAQITFVSAPEAGARLSIDFTGYLKVHCRFENDDLPERLRHRDLSDLTVKLHGVLNE